MRSDWDRLHENQAVRDVRDAAAARARHDKKMRNLVAADNAQRNRGTSSKLGSSTLGAPNKTTNQNRDGFAGFADRLFQRAVDYSEDIKSAFLNMRLIAVFVCLLSIVLVNIYYNSGQEEALKIAVLACIGYVATPIVLIIAVQLVFFIISVIVRAVPIALIIGCIVLAVLAFNYFSGS